MKVLSIAIHKFWERFKVLENWVKPKGHQVKGHGIKQKVMLKEIKIYKFLNMKTALIQEIFRRLNIVKSR